ncbi:uncharacterized protein LOC127874778 isoform X1 [Dreissena polymorpha]|uniref:uncharacterized protein LOC127874778 isoform X1 n=1 Tax=Dreissena polymorpha TaxID=45954 RepID=UPI0022653C22|nr:uncharacterized protein LOC127874778 isoform X1 [Dreissena polymorpha]
MFQNSMPANVNPAFYLPGMTNQNPAYNNLQPVRGTNQAWGGNIMPNQVYNNVPYQQAGFYPIQNALSPNSQLEQQVQPRPQAQLPNFKNSVQGSNGQAVEESSGTNQTNSSVKTKLVDQGAPKPVAMNKAKILPDYQDLSKDLDYQNSELYDAANKEAKSSIKKQPEDVSKGVSGNYKDAPTVNRQRTQDMNTPTRHEDMDDHNGRHSEETEILGSHQDGHPTLPPTSKTKSQISKPTQSTVAGQKVGSGQLGGHKNSEDFLDYPWLNYEQDPPRVSGKKGSRLNPVQVDKSTSNDRDGGNHVVDGDKILNSKQTYSKQESDSTAKNKVQPMRNRGGQPSRYDVDDYAFDYRKPSGGNRRPVYDRYGNRLDKTGNSQGPVKDSRYPYYDSGYPEGKNRNPYPVWDPYKDEYYYPDTETDPDITPDENQKLGLGFDSVQKGKTDDMSYKDAEESSKSKGSPNVNGPADKPSVQNTPSVTVPVAEPTPAPTQKQDPEANKAGTTSTETPKTVSSATGLSTSKQVEKDSKNSITESKNSITESKNSNTVSKNSNTESKNTDTGSMKIESSSKNVDQNSKNSGSDGKNSNSSSANVSDENGVSYHILNSGMVKVESFTDGSLGPVVALSLGLAITLMLLIFVGCRLRTVKRRLRKGRALHSNEADYLINGMYL